MKKRKQIVDTVFNKRVYLNDSQLPGVEAVKVEWDINNAPTKVHLTLHVAHGSLKVLGNKIAFKTVRP